MGMRPIPAYARIPKLHPCSELLEWRRNQLDNIDTNTNKYMKALTNQRIDLKQRSNDDFQVINSAKEWERVLGN